MSDETANELTDELTYTMDGRRVAFVLDESIYTREAVYGAAYLFVDRAFVFLTRPAPGQIEVRLKAREETDEPGLEALAGSFCNELLNQLVREQVTKSTQRIREYYIGRAFFGDDSRASIDALLAELDAEELEEEPLEIAVPWETGDGA